MALNYYEGSPLFDEEAAPTSQQANAEKSETSLRSFDEYVQFFQRAIDERLKRDIEDRDPPEDAIPDAISAEPFSGEYLQIQVLKELGYKVQLMGWLEELVGDSPESHSVSLSVEEPDRSAVDSIRLYTSAPAISHPRGLEPPFSHLLHGICDTYYMHANHFDPDGESYGNVRRAMYASGHDAEQSEELLRRMFMTATILDEIRDDRWPKESSRHHPNDLPLYAFFHSQGVKPLELTDLYDMEKAFTAHLLANNPDVQPPASRHQQTPEN